MSTVYKLRSVALFCLYYITPSDAFLDRRESENMDKCYDGAVEKCKATDLVYYSCCYGDCCINPQPILWYGALILTGLIVIFCTSISCACFYTYCIKPCCCKRRNRYPPANRNRQEKQLLV